VTKYAQFADFELGASFEGDEQPLGSTPVRILFQIAFQLDFVL
jgi:hypothetical protein